MSARLRLVLVAVLVLAVIVVVAAEVLVRAIAVPTFSACRTQAPRVIVGGFDGGAARVATGCVAGRPFVPTTTATGDRLVIDIPESAAVSFERAAQLRVQAWQYEASELPPVLRLVDLFAPTTHVALVEHAAGEPQALELAQPNVIADGADSRIEFEHGGLPLDDGTQIVVVGLPR